MKIKKIIIGFLALSILSCACVLGACGNEFSVEPTDKTYSPTLGYTAPAHDIDAGMKIDGIIDEAAYTEEGHRWYNGIKIDGNERAEMDMTVMFGEEGIYFAYDVRELTNRVYYNPVRDTFLNSGIEMYLATPGTTVMESEGTFEIDMQCSGVLGVKKFILGTWKSTAAPYDVAPKYAAATHGGNYNTALCTGYSGELFVPYEYFVHFGLAEEGEKIDEVYVNPVLITAYGYDGTTTNDRNWYNTAGEDTDGNGWSNPSTFLHFNKNGLVSYDINTEITGKGNVSTQKGYDFALKDNSLTLNVTAENGYTLDTLTVNDVNYKDKLEYNDGVAQIFLPTVNADVNVKATFVETSATQRSVKGNIIPQGVNASKGVYDMEVSLFDGFNYNALRTINGSFAGNVPEGDYALVVLSKSEGYEITRQNIKVDKDLTDIVVNIDDTMYGDTAAIRFDGLSLGLGSKTVNLPKPVMSDKFVFTFRLGVGVDGASFPVDKYVEEISLQTESGAYIAFQLLRWNQPGETQGQFETKILLDGYDVQSQGLFSQDFTDLVLSQGYLDFALVRNDRVLTIYAKNANGEYEQLGTASLFSAIGDEPITTYRLSGAEGVTAQVGVKISECVIYQGTDDINIIKN